MPETITMPKLGLTMTHGMVARWLKKEGDQVGIGEPIAEIETDKITNEVESTAEGYVLKLLVEEGADVEITAPICIVGGKGEQYSLPGAGAAVQSAAENLEFRISPAAKRLAQENGVEAASLRGTGPEGRITKEDVQAELDRRNTGSSGSAQAALASAEEAAGDMRIPLSGARKVIAQRLSQSKREIPHTYFKISVDATEIMKLKNGLSGRIQSSSGKKLSLNDIIVKAVASALREMPEINCTMEQDAIVRHASVNIGVAVSLENGLMVPVIRNADRKTLAVINEESAQLIEKARSGKLTQADVSGGTFTISNLGAYGIDEFTAIINPPEVAILAVGAAKETPCAVNGEVVIKPLMSLTLSVDHRAIDGAAAARFLKMVKESLENPYGLLL